jgi:Peptidase family M23
MLAVLAAAALASQFHIKVANLPLQPFIETRGETQIVNFDLLLHNDGQKPLRLAAIHEQLFDKSGRLEAQRELNGNGKPSALAGLGDTVINPGETKDIFQPFDRYDGSADLSRIHLTLVFLKPETPVPPVALTGDAIAQIDVRPLAAARPAAYCLPLDGALLIHDGHDLNSHHRRQNLAARFDRDPKNAANPNLYAYDFVHIDESGALYKGDPNRKENWFTFGAPVHAPVDGEVVVAVDGVPDNSFADTQPVTPPLAQKLDPDGFGNHVAIRAADGRVSWLLHMEAGSIAVKKGQRVKAGDLLGKIGFSGDALFPHEHYTVTNAATYPSQGVPSYFRAFHRRAKNGSEAVPYGQIDTGDIVTNDAACAR